MIKYGKIYFKKEDSLLSNLSDEQINNFSTQLLTWFEQHGRHDLPWQQHRTVTPDVYQVWLSEVMLQQTQVKTVIPYFQRFMASFPTVADLANADWEEIAEHWAGLGYYARARNLHKGAKQVVKIIEKTGDFPQTVDEWQQISGVGRSTAGAIVAMGLHSYGVICDGNVKRVLTRWAGIDGDISKSATDKQLWQLAEKLTPSEQSGNFAQAMMDMGATVCVRTKPICLQNDLLDTATCPLQADCVAYAQGKQTFYPVKAKNANKISKYSNALLIINAENKTLWVQRPQTGIWGGLWCLPLQFTHKIDKKKTITLNDDKILYEKEFNLAEKIIDKFLQENQLTKNTAEKAIKHTLTHFHWYLTAEIIKINKNNEEKLTKLLTQDNINYQFLNKTQAQKNLALPKAMLKILQDV